MIFKYIWNVLIALDQLANALLGGDPDETLSSRMGKRINTCVFCRFFCWVADKIDPNHCVKSLEYDEGI